MEQAMNRELTPREFIERLKKQAELFCYQTDYHIKYGAKARRTEDEWMKDFVLWLKSEKEGEE
jgi:hypothetical protein